jgi:hypothetical protein
MDLSSDPRWRKSTRSNSTGDCVEVADNLAGQVLVRDTKDRDGGTLAFAPAAWSTFVHGVKRHP